MFLDSLEDPAGRGKTLFVLMNWMGSDTEPAAWETEIDEADTGTQEEDRALTAAVFACIGEDITDRTTIQSGPFGEDTLLIDGKEVGAVEWH